MGATRKFLERTFLVRDENFQGAFEALLNALPVAVAHPGVREKDRRGEWYLREIAQHILSGKVQVPVYTQEEFAFESAGGGDEGGGRTRKKSSVHRRASSEKTISGSEGEGNGKTAHVRREE